MPSFLAISIANIFVQTTPIFHLDYHKKLPTRFPVMYCAPRISSQTADNRSFLIWVRSYHSFKKIKMNITLVITHVICFLNMVLWECHITSPICSPKIYNLSLIMKQHQTNLIWVKFCKLPDQYFLNLSRSCKKKNRQIITDWRRYK